ncbi:hypothetical protein GE09DRAFT_197862 [Coniochaeta sp. 2T2.1]|nr:hypothetical protein GE09DRAFT_197862 [Coniochaeta sp. 2T2.1]
MNIPLHLLPPFLILHLWNLACPSSLLRAEGRLTSDRNIRIREGRMGSSRRWWWWWRVLTQEGILQLGSEWFLLYPAIQAGRAQIGASSARGNSHGAIEMREAFYYYQGVFGFPGIQPVPLVDWGELTGRSSPTKARHGNKNPLASSHPSNLVPTTNELDSLTAPWRIAPRSANCSFLGSQSIICG